MIRIEMPLKDFSFLRKEFEKLDDYLIHLSYSKDEVTFEIPNEKYDAFILDYRSAIVRKGTDGKENFNDVGVQLNNIFNTYII